MRISIFGIGYVGVVSGACLADLGHQVVGVDVNPRKVDMLNAGQSPVVEERIAELVQQAVADKRLSATTDVAQAVAGTEVSFISVGTPPKSNGAPALEALDQVVRDIGTALRNKPGSHAVVVRSTVPPGTSLGRVLPALREASGRDLGQGLELGFNPEFLREGSSVRDFYNPPFTILGAATAAGHAVLREIYAPLKAPVIETDCGVAESVKYACNAFHAAKIAFANEVGTVMKRLGIDSRQVMEIFCQDRELNISPAYLRPGFAFGGSCLPKDIQAMLALGRQQDANLPFLGNVLASTEAHIDRALAMIQRHGRKRVALFGLAFKHGTDDLRASPFVTLAERLIGKGYELSIHDPFVQLSRLMGKNREFIEQEIPHFERLLAADAKAALAGAEIIVIGHVAKDDIAVICAAAPGRVLIDLQGVRQLEKLAGVTYDGICW